MIKTLVALTNLFDGFSYSGSTNNAKMFNDEGAKHDNDCVILKRNSDQGNTPALHNSESSSGKTLVSESSDSSKGYVKNSMTDKTVTVNLLSKFYIDLKVHTLYHVRFLIDAGSAVNALNKEMFLKICKQSPELKVRSNLHHMVRPFPP